MLRISFDQITSKRRIVLNKSSLVIPVGNSVLLQGDKDVVSAVFARILYQKQCQCSLDEEVLDKEFLMNKIVLLTDDGALPLTKRIKTFFSEIGYEKSQTMKILRIIGLEAKLNYHVFRLTKEERVLLSLQLACCAHVSVLLLDKDWTKHSTHCQNKITMLLERYLADGNFLLVSEKAKHLISYKEQYTIEEDKICSKQSLVSNFLEEKGFVKEDTIYKQTFWMRIKHKLSFLSIMGSSLYYMLSTVFMLLFMIMLLGFSLTIKHLDTLIETEQEKDVFHADIRVCTNQVRPNEYCNDSVLTSQQIQILSSFDEIERVYPIHEIYFGLDQMSQSRSAKLLADGEVIPQNLDTNIFDVVMISYDASLLNIQQKFHNVDESLKGIYISKNLLVANQEMFAAIEGKEWTVKGNLEIPIYSQRVEMLTYDQQDEATYVTQIMPVKKSIEVELPILGVLEDDNYGMYVDEQLFFELQEQLLQKYPKEDEYHEYMNGFDQGIIDNYQPSDYKAILPSYDDLVAVEEKLKETDATIKIINSVTSLQANKQMQMDAQVQMKKSILPALLVCTSALGMYMLVAYYIQKNNVLYAYHHQKLKRNHKFLLIRKILFTCFCNGVFISLLIAIFSSPSFTQTFILYMLNSSYFSQLNLMEHPVYMLLTSINQVFLIYSTSITSCIMILLFSSCLGILRFLPSLYISYKLRKQL